MYGTTNWYGSMDISLCFDRCKSYKFFVHASYGDQNCKCIKTDDCTPRKASDTGVLAVYEITGKKAGNELYSMPQKYKYNVFSFLSFFIKINCFSRFQMVDFWKWKNRLQRGYGREGSPDTGCWRWMGNSNSEFRRMPKLM